ncbi:MAG TPA: extracellular solute-binding protein [Ruminiclostridium sp.]|nr:extracellular solute-binding protein [Ruminiclostridium sp.]
MKRASRILSVTLAGVLCAASLAACGGSNQNTSGATQTGISSSQKSAGGPVKLKFTAPQLSTDPGIVHTIEFAKKELNTDLEFEEIASDKYLDKISVVLLANNADFDFFYSILPNMGAYVNANAVMPVDDLAKKAGIDMEKKFGASIQKINGNIYQLPNTKDIWMTMYNKKIFDEAGVAYPSADGWTWDKYIETAKKISNPKKGIYGSFLNQNNDTFRILLAQQQGVSVYKKDGTTNFDDPAFAKSFKFLKDMDDNQMQINYMNYVSQKAAWDTFAAGKVGMTVNGGWSIDFVTKQKDYPRDWECGILPMPAVDAAHPTTLSVIGGYFLPTNTSNPDAAFRVAEQLAEKEYTFNPQRLPTVAGLSKEELLKYIDTTYMPNFKNGEVKDEDIYNAWFNPDRKLESEKFIGPACTELTQMVIDEVDPYLLGKKSLEDTVKTLKEKGDEALKDAD